MSEIGIKDNEASKMIIEAREKQNYFIDQAITINNLDIDERKILEILIKLDKYINVKSEFKKIRTNHNFSNEFPKISNFIESMDLKNIGSGNHFQGYIEKEGAYFAIISFMDLDDKEKSAFIFKNSIINLDESKPIISQEIEFTLNDSFKPAHKNQLDIRAYLGKLKI